jgi:hypothetical protein
MILVNSEFNSKGFGISLPFRPPRQRSSFDPNYPYGQPQEIDYSLLDQAGVELVQEMNRHPWLATVDYCSGHPSDRPPSENTPISIARDELAARFMPNAFRWNYWEEIKGCMDAYVAGNKSKTDYLIARNGLTELSKTTLRIAMFVGSLKPFIYWMRLVFMGISAAFLGLPEYEMPKLTLNPMKCAKHELNFIFEFEYFGVAHRQVVHDIMLDALREIPL